VFQQPSIGKCLIIYSIVFFFLSIFYFTEGFVAAQKMLPRPASSPAASEEHDIGHVAHHATSLPIAVVARLNLAIHCVSKMI
jgi:hypothetical protein